MATIDPETGEIISDIGGHRRKPNIGYRPKRPGPPERDLVLRPQPPSREELKQLLSRALDLLEEAEWGVTLDYYGDWDGTWCLHCKAERRTDNPEHKPGCPWFTLMQEAGRK